MAVFRIGHRQTKTRAITRSRFIKSANTGVCARGSEIRARVFRFRARAVNYPSRGVTRRNVSQASSTRARARALITARLHGENFGIILDYSNPGSLLSARARTRASIQIYAKI